MVSLGEATELIKLCRMAVENYLEDSIVIKPPQEGRSEKAGIFVTLNYLTTNKQEYLRGCIGFPLAEKSLHESAVDAAIAAATQDPRFPPVDKRELDNVIFEISILTPPQQILGSGPDDYKKEIKIGRDGLILHSRFGSGLLLPQVPVEMKWNVEEFLANICYKAGAPLDAWISPSSKLFKFQALIFKEVEPKGRVVEIEL